MYLLMWDRPLKRQNDRLGPCLGENHCRAYATKRLCDVEKSCHSEIGRKIVIEGGEVVMVCRPSPFAQNM